MFRRRRRRRKRSRELDHKIVNRTESIKLSQPFQCSNMQPMPAVLKFLPIQAVPEFKKLRPKYFLLLRNFEGSGTYKTEL
jgi:hypothetical protein